MKSIKHTSNIHKSLFSVLVMCLFCFISTKGIAKSDSDSHIVASVVNVEFNSIEVGGDDNDSPDDSLYYENYVDLAVLGQSVLSYTFDSFFFKNYYFFNVRAPPFN